MGRGLDPVGAPRRIGDGEGRDLLVVGVDEADRAFATLNRLTAGDFDRSRAEIPGFLLGVADLLGLLLLVTFKVAELVIVICCCGRLNPSLGEQGADADWTCKWGLSWATWGFKSPPSGLYLPPTGLLLGSSSLA